MGLLVLNDVSLDNCLVVNNCICGYFIFGRVLGGNMDVICCNIGMKLWNMSVGFDWCCVGRREVIEYWFIKLREWGIEGEDLIVI